MARQPRYNLPGVPQHIIQRGNNRSTIFHSEKDYLFYLEKLLDASHKHGCMIHAYVLMSNHVHLLVSPIDEDSISKMQQMVGRYYVQYFNYCYKRTGTLWEGRYKATVVDKEQYLYHCMRYIEMNPIRAHMVNKPEDYRWSSYRHNALGHPDPIITPHEKYLLLGKTDLMRQQSYFELCKSLLTTKELNNIRQMTNSGWALGSDSFKQIIGQNIGRPLEAVQKGGDRKSRIYQEKINRV